MATAYNLPEQAKIVEALAPAADAAGRTSAYVTLKNAHKGFIIIHITQGNAATVLLSLLQAKTVAGGSSKAGPSVPIWSDLDTATSDALVKQTDAATYTTDAAVKNKIVVFEVDPSKLDIANGFDCIGVSTGASNAANITQAEFILTPLRQQAGTPESARVD